MRVRVIAALTCGVLLSASVASCGSGSGNGNGTSNALRITAQEYKFAVDGDLSSGVATIDVENKGRELHETAFGKLRPGKTEADARAAMKSADPGNDNPLKDIVEERSTLESIGSLQLPGTTLKVTGAGLEPGNYVLACFIPNSKGTPHASLGMLTGFTVKTDVSKDLPKADVTFTSTKAKTTGPTKVDAGTTTIGIRNASGAAREALLLKVKKGNTIADVDAFFKKLDQEGPGDLSKAPLEFFTFVFDAKDGDRYLTVDLTPGQWAIAMQDPDNHSDLPPEKDPTVVLFQVS